MKETIIRILRNVAIGLAAFILLMLVVFIVVGPPPSPRHWLPTHSKPGELRLAASGASAGKLSVSLILSDGSSYVLNTDPGVFPGEPQHYPLPPDLSDKDVTVRIVFNDHNLIRSEIDAVFLPSNGRTSDIKRYGLLIYFSDSGGTSVYVISGRTRLCYVYIEEASNWVVWENPPLITPYPDGMGADPDWSSGWESNTWEYVPADSTSKDQQK